MSIRFLIPGVRTLVGSISVTGQMLTGDGTAAAPSIALQAYPTTGFYKGASADFMNFSAAGSLVMDFSANGILFTSPGVWIRNTGPSSTTPNILPNRTDNDSGIGQNAVDEVAIIAGGIESIRADKSTTPTQTRMLIYDVDNATLERVTVGIADSGGAGFKLLRIAN